MQRLLTLLLLVAPLLCQADPVRSTLFGFSDARTLRFVETRAGMLVAVSGSRAGVYRVSPEGMAEARPLFAANLDSIRALGRDVLTINPTRLGTVTVPAVQRVRFETGTATRTVLYAADAEGIDLRAEPALGEDSVYVLVRYPAGRHVLLNVRTTGAVRWKWDLGATEPQILPITGGVLMRFEQHREGHNGQESFWDIAVVEDSGKVRWRSSYERVADDALAFVPPARIAMLQKPSYAAGTDVRYIDARDGTTTLATLPAPASELQATPAGLLFTGSMLDQPHAVLVRGDASIAWSRRFPLQTAPHHQLLGATVTRAGDLWLAGNTYEVLANGRDWNTSVTLLRTSAANPAPPPACLDVDVSEIARLQREMARSAVFVSLIRDRTRFSDAGCATPSDSEYLQFMRELGGALSSGLINRQPIMVDVTAEQQGYLRSAYNEVTEAYCCFGPCQTDAAVRYAANLASGAELGQHIRSSVVPHLRRMADQRARFALLTGETLQVFGSAEPSVVRGRHHYAMQRGTPGPADMELFSALENGAATLIREIEHLPAGQLESHRKQRSDLNVAERTFLFNEASLSVGSQHWPVQALRRAVRELYDPANVTAEHDP